MNNSAVKSDIFVDKISDKRMFSREFRASNFNRSTQSNYSQIEAPESPVSRLKKQIYIDNYGSTIPSPNLRMSQNMRRSNMSTNTKSMNHTESTLELVDRLKPVSILKQTRKATTDDRNLNYSRRELLPLRHLSPNKFRKQPFLASLLINQPKELQKSNLLKAKTANFSNNPVRFNPIVRSDEPKEPDLEIMDENEDIYQNEAVMRKCNEWLDKYVLPFVSLVNNSTSNVRRLSNEYEN